MGWESRRCLPSAGVPRSTPRILMIVIILTVVFTSIYQLSSQTDRAAYYKYLYEKMSRYMDKQEDEQKLLAQQPNLLHRPGYENAVHSHWDFKKPCAKFPDTKGIMLVMKTGASESHDKMPMQFLSSLQCLDDFLLFSDKEQQIGPYHFHNALDAVADSVKKDRKEFELYESQLTCPISQQECGIKRKDAWNLDKYKFLNMIERTWKMRPGYEWYVFAEADTYLFWSNLVPFLRERNATEELYVGSIAYLGGFPFAHGGSGYVISGTAMRRLVEEQPDLGRVYDERAPDICCGDTLVAKALDSINISVHQAAPMFNSEKTNGLKFGSKTWCQPIMSMHHVNAEEVSQLWQFEQSRSTEDLVQLRDVYQTFLAPHMQEQREDWDNDAQEKCYQSWYENENKKKDSPPPDDRNIVEREAYTSHINCAKGCAAAGLDINEKEYLKIQGDEEQMAYIKEQYKNQTDSNPNLRLGGCLTWRYFQGDCCMSKSVRLGGPKAPSPIQGRHTSGWFLEGIKNWIDFHGQCEDAPRWHPLRCVGGHCPKKEDEEEKKEKDTPK